MPYADPARNAECDRNYRRSDARRESWRRYWTTRRPRYRLRLSLHRRDRWRCHYCGKRGTMRTLTKDHVMPFSRGGKHTLDNLVSACRSCNQRKGVKPYEVFVDQLREERGLKPTWAENDPELWAAASWFAERKETR